MRIVLSVFKARLAKNRVEPKIDVEDLRDGCVAIAFEFGRRHGCERRAAEIWYGRPVRKRCLGAGYYGQHCSG